MPTDRRLILNDMRVLSSKLATHAVTLEDPDLCDQALALNARVVLMLQKEQDTPGEQEEAFNRLLGMGSAE